MQQIYVKNFFKKKGLILCLLAVLVISTVVITLIALRTAPKEETADDTDVIKVTDSSAVAKPVDEPQQTEQKVPADLAEPFDTSGVNGLTYVSNGDGTCSIADIGTCEDTELKIPIYSPSGEKVTKIGNSAFINNTSLLTVSIPATVKSIGMGAFRGCANLVAINVDTENTVYCSVGGVLMSKDRSVLICVPMNRAGSTYLLSTNTKAIAAYAFEGVLNLKNLLYEGNIASFQKIEILTGNGILDHIAITCNYVPLK